MAAAVAGLAVAGSNAADGPPPDPRLERIAAQIVRMGVPAIIDRRAIDEAFAVAAAERGEDADSLVGDAERDAALAAASEAYEAWATQGLPELRMAVAAELRASGSGTPTPKAIDRLMHATDRIAEIDAIAFAQLAAACGDSTRPLVARAAALHQDRFWQAGMAVGGGFARSDLETIAAACRGGDPLPASAEPILLAYRSERLAMLREIRDGFLRGVADSARIGLDLQAWMAAKADAADPEHPEPSIDPMAVMGLAMLAQLLPMQRPLERLSDLQQRTLDALLPDLSPPVAWCLLATLAADGSGEDPASAMRSREVLEASRRIEAQARAAGETAGGTQLALLAAWQVEDAAMLRRWIRLRSDEAAAVAAICRTAVARTPIDFDRLAAEVARRNDPAEPATSAALLVKRLQRADEAFGAMIAIGANVATER